MITKIDTDFLTDLLGFRHFVRSAYGIELRQSETFQKVRKAIKRWPLIAKRLKKASRTNLTTSPGIQRRSVGELRPPSDHVLRVKLSEEQRRLLIVQAVYTRTVEKLGFLGAAGFISHVLNQMPDLVNFLLESFPPDSP